MEDNSGKSPQQQPEGQDKETPRRPRGLGGVLLIMLLLLALFVMVSQAGLDPKYSIYDFYRVLFNGDVVKINWQDDGKKIAVTFKRTDTSDASNTTMELLTGKFTEDDRALIASLVARKLDRQTYKSGLDAFAEDVNDDKIRVRTAIILSKVEATREDFKPSADLEPFPGKNFMTALVQRGNLDEYVRVVPGTNETMNLQSISALLESKGAKVLHRDLVQDPTILKVSETNTALVFFLSSVGPYILVIAIVWFFIFRQMRSPGSGGGVLSFGRSRAAVYTKENRTNVTFEDIAGAVEAKDEVREVIEFLKHPGKFAKLGGIIPRGVLLAGPPGTGKTLMAKAIAGEAEVPFFSISGSDFVEMFVGVGASRVRDLFKQARECSPCIIFLDEIDAVGRKRGSGMGGGHDEREQTLNAILVEMDGFDSDKGIILVAATNRPDVLDPALLRPGRFDRQIVIDMPDVTGREAILTVHGRKVKLAPSIDLQRIARATPGFSGADLAAIMNESAILAAMKGQDVIEMADLEEARDRVRWGREKRSRALEEEDKKVTAYHEAGHALVSIKIPDLDPVHKVTIVSRGMALGATMSLPERDDYHLRKNKLLGMIAMAYGGRIAEDIVFGDISAGAQNDIEQATNIAKTMITELGMSEKIGPINYSRRGDAGFLGGQTAIAYDLSPETMEAIHQEIRDTIQEQYSRAKALILQHRDQLDRIAEALLVHETLTGEEVAAIARGDNLEEFRAARKRAEAERRPPVTAPQPTDEPDIGLSGAEGLAHP
jgi:cell division protease FtsH